MEDKPKTLQEHAMRFGTMMGIFWIIKFSFLPMGFKIPLLQLLFIFMTLFVPILGYIYIRKYRERYCGGELSFLRGIFAIYVFFCITADSRCTLHIFPVHRQRISYRNLYGPTGKFEGYTYRRSGNISGPVNPKS